MKKFLSLVLALVMTMSLVTIGASATEYKDLTDKDEIQYEEAVAVLNRIGIITGYSDGSFQPTRELTRGAAAKIIVSLLIGPEAAENLSITAAPYPDVPLDHTFAAVISYCKTAGIISGYSDGTFKPGNPLTGFAFSKMLLGALGYDAELEGFVGSGWNMKVANVGSKANLFNHLDFQGNDPVNREEACQLALNTLKATMVEYTGGFNITVGDATVVGDKTRTYVTSNQAYATNISNRKASNVGNASSDNHYTVEFGEEHFKDLVLVDEHGTRNTVNNSGTYSNIARDDFGRPANEWSYKKVTIGTFPIEPDYVYTTQVAHNVPTVTDANKVRALGLNGYELKSDAVYTTTSTGIALYNNDVTNLWLNGRKWGGRENPNELKENDANAGHVLETVGDIADYTDNGTVVEVYISEDDADFIQDVVVVKTQLMEVKTVKSEAVSLKLYDEKSDAKSDAKTSNNNATTDGILYGFNQAPADFNVNDVELNDACYAALSAMKSGDIVAVVPYWAGSDTENYNVGRVYTPETVSGELTRVDTYGTVNVGPNAIKTTVGGTDYDIALWNKDLYDINGTTIRVTRKDVTIYLDEFGNAMLAKDVGATSNFIVIGGYHSGLVDGKVVTFVDGWDISGNEISLNIGNIQYDGIHYRGLIGSLMHYSSDTGSKYAEWDLDYLGVYDVASLRGENDADKSYSLKASSGKVRLNGYDIKATGWATESGYKGNDVGNIVDKNGDEAVKPAKLPHEYVNGDKCVTTNVNVDDAGVKVIYVTMDSDDNEVDSIEIKNGMQAITNEEIVGAKSDFVHKRAQACVSLKDNNTKVKDGDSVVKAIVIKLESGSANLSDLIYISNYAGSASKGVGTDRSGKSVYGYQVNFIGQSDWDTTKTIYSYKELPIGTFARSRKAAEAPTEVRDVTEDNFYTLTGYGDKELGNARIHKALSVLPFAQIQNIMKDNKTLLRLTNYEYAGGPAAPLAAAEKFDQPKTANIALELNDYSDLDLGDSSAQNVVSINRARIIDLTGNGIKSASDLKDMWNKVSTKEADQNYHRKITVSLVFNDKWNDDEFRDVYALIITNVSKIDDTYQWVEGATPAKPDPKPEKGDVWLADNLVGADVGTILDGSEVKVDEWGEVSATFTLEKPDWAASGHHNWHSGALRPTAYVEFNVYRDGEPLVKGTKAINVDMDGNMGVLVADDDEGTTFTGTVYLGSGTAGGLVPTDLKNKEHSYSLQISKITWNWLPVEFVVEGGKDMGLPTDMWTENDASARDLNFVASKNSGKNATATITGVENAASISVAISSNTRTTALSAVKPLTNQKVVINVKPAADYEETFNVTVSSANVNADNAGDGALTGGAKLSYFVGDEVVLPEGATITFAPVTATVAKDGVASISAVLNKAKFGDIGVYKYTVSVTANGETKTQDIVDGSGTTKVYFNFSGVTKDIEVKAADVKVTRTERPHVVSAKVVGQDLIYTLSEAVQYADGYSDGEGEAPVSNGTPITTLSSDGMTITTTAPSGKTWGTAPYDDCNTNPDKFVSKANPDIKMAHQNIDGLETPNITWNNAAK